MKSGTQLRLLAGAVLIAVVTWSPAVCADTQTSGGTQEGVYVADTFLLHQDSYTVADNLEFRAEISEPWTDIIGWRIRITHFDASSSEQREDDDYDGVDVAAWLGLVDKCVSVQVDVELWLSNENEVYLEDVEWTSGEDSLKTVPNFGWEIEAPMPNPSQPGQILHTLRIRNTDPSGDFWLTGIKYLASEVLYSDLTSVPFPADSLTATRLFPGQSLVIHIPTASDKWCGRYIYHTFAIREDDGSGSPDYSQPAELLNIGGHEVNCLVPTASLWGLFVLGLLLAAAGAVTAWHMRRTAKVRAC